MMNLAQGVLKLGLFVTVLVTGGPAEKPCLPSHPPTHRNSTAASQLSCQEREDSATGGEGGELGHPQLPGRRTPPKPPARQASA